MLRDGIKRGLPLALKAKEKIDRGELVDDRTMIGIVRERLSRDDTNAGFVLDGFPRTVFQGRELDAMMEELGKGPLIVIDITVPEEELVRRLAARRVCSTCGMNAEPIGEVASVCRRCGGTFAHRADDDDRVVRERLRVYAEQTKPVVDYYVGRPTFRAVNGAQPPDRVADELEATIVDAARTLVGFALGAQGQAGR